MLVSDLMFQWISPGCHRVHLFIGNSKILPYTCMCLSYSRLFMTKKLQQSSINSPKQKHTLGKIVVDAQIRGSSLRHHLVNQYDGLCKHVSSCQCHLHIMIHLLVWLFAAAFPSLCDL